MAPAQGNSEDVLPEALLGSIRLKHLDLSVAQYLDTATGELAPRQTPTQRRCGPLRAAPSY